MTLEAAWAAHEAELGAWLRAQCRNRDEAAEILQDTFVRALHQGPRFDQVREPRAWLYTVARRLLIDRARARRPLESLPDELADEIAAPQADASPVSALIECLPVALAGLTPADRELIQHCDLDGEAQAAAAQRLGVSLPALKSRLLRARQRLTASLTRACGVRFDERGQVCCHRPPGAHMADTISS